MAAPALFGRTPVISPAAFEPCRPVMADQDFAAPAGVMRQGVNGPHHTSEG
jgi:hypothetical protein